MIDELLPYYNQELSYFRQAADEFAKKFPKVASHLRLGSGVVEDPDVARMVESFAFLNAGIRHKIDDGFPELTQALLETLYPHYLAPIPAASVIQFQCREGLNQNYVIPAKTSVETAPTYETQCRFETTYPVTVWPIQVNSATLRGLPFNAPPLPNRQDALSVIRLELSCQSEKMTFSELLPDKLRFFLNAPPEYVHTLYELILNHTIGISIAASGYDSEVIYLDSNSIEPVGFALDEALFPYPARSIVGYRLLTEFFTFPEKFLFFNLTQLDLSRLKEVGNRLEVFLYLNRMNKELEKAVCADYFKLGCTPVVNLFTQTAEPIRLTHTQVEHPVIPDARRPDHMDVYSIEKVMEFSQDGLEKEFLPFYAVNHETSHEKDRRFWHMNRKSSTSSYSTLSITDLAFNPREAQDSILYVQLVCTNGNLPNELPWGGGNPKLQLSTLPAPISDVRCLMPFTRTATVTPKKETYWKLISHLSLNQLSLVDQSKDIETLKEMLYLYQFKNSEDSRNLIESIVSVKSKRVVSRSCVGFRGVILQGIEILLEVDEVRFSRKELYLFGKVLDCFFSNYASINSFTQLTFTSLHKEGVLYQWPPRTGDRFLL